MKKLFFTIFILSLCSASFAQKLSKEKTRAFISKVAHKQDLSSSKTFSVPACLLDSLVGSHWDTTTNSWQRIYKEAYAYDAQSNNTSLFYYNSTNPPSLTPIYSVTQSYNSQNTLTLSLFTNWDQNSSTWFTSSRSTYTYNTSGDKTKELDEIWDSTSNAWQNSGRISYSYTATHSLTVEQGEYWSGTTWANSYKSINAYNSASNPTLSAFCSWDQSNTAFDTLQKITFVYSGNNLSSAISIYWDQTTNTWENEFSYAYTYSGSNITLQEEQTWVNGTWANSGSYAFTYDSQNNVLTETDVFIDVETGEVTDQYLSQYYYRCNLVGIKELSAKPKFNLYPSPAQSVLSIESETAFEGCKIINISGQLVFESHELVKQISVSNLEKGIYFIQLLDKNKNVLATEKFLKD